MTQRIIRQAVLAVVVLAAVAALAVAATGWGVPAAIAVLVVPSALAAVTGSAVAAAHLTVTGVGRGWRDVTAPPGGRHSRTRQESARLQAAVRAGRPSADPMRRADEVAFAQTMLLPADPTRVSSMRTGLSRDVVTVLPAAALGLWSWAAGDARRALWWAAVVVVLLILGLVGRPVARRRLRRDDAVARAFLAAAGEPPSR